MLERNSDLAVDAASAASRARFLLGPLQIGDFAENADNEMLSADFSHGRRHQEGRNRAIFAPQAEFHARYQRFCSQAPHELSRLPQISPKL